MKFMSLLLTITIIFSGCSQVSEDITAQSKQDTQTSAETAKSEPVVEESTVEEPIVESEPIAKETNTSSFDDGSYTEVSVDSCDQSGSRIANAKVDVGYDSDYANREYWAYTNEYEQLVHVEADEIILQSDDQELSGDDDRYCSDEAKVPGVEAEDLDEGHVIADSLGGASNAYNITPQGSQLNRYGTQADIEEEIRSAGGATNFVADIEYPDSDTQIPSAYTLSYEINGIPQSYTYDNEYTLDGEEPVDTTESSSNDSSGDVYYENCTAVRDAGAAPIHDGDPGYSSKLDRDGDGTGCE